MTASRLPLSRRVAACFQPRAFIARCFASASAIFRAGAAPFAKTVPSLEDGGWKMDGKSSAVFPAILDPRSSILAMAAPLFRRCCPRAILYPLFAILVLASPASAALSTNNVIFNLGDIVGRSGQFKSVSISTVEPLIVNGRAYSTRPPTLNIANDAGQITNNYVVFTNLLCGPACVISIADAYSVTTTNFTISDTNYLDADGNVVGFYYIGPYVRGIGQFYAATRTTNISVTIGGSGLNAAQSNLLTMVITNYVATNASVASYDTNTHTFFYPTNYEAVGRAAALVAALGVTTPANFTNAANTIRGTFTNANGKPLIANNETSLHLQVSSDTGLYLGVGDGDQWQINNGNFDAVTDGGYDIGGGNRPDHIRARTSITTSNFIGNLLGNASAATNVPAAGVGTGNLPATTTNIAPFSAALLTGNQTLPPGVLPPTVVTNNYTGVNAVNVLRFCGTNLPNAPMLAQDGYNAHGWYDQSTNINAAINFCYTNRQGINTLFFPVGIWRIANQRILVPEGVNIVGSGFFHYGIQSYLDLPTTNYSMLWFDSTNALGVEFFNVGAGSPNQIENIQIQGFTNPVAQGLTIYANPLTTYGYVGLQAVCTNLSWAGGFRAKKVSVCGFRVGVNCQMGQSTFDQCVWILNGIGWANYAESGYMASLTNSLPIVQYYWSNMLAYIPRPPLGFVQADNTRITQSGGGYQNNGLCYWVQGRNMQIDHDSSYSYARFALVNEVSFRMSDSYVEAYGPKNDMTTNFIVALANTSVSLDNVTVNYGGATTNQNGDRLTNACLVDCSLQSSYGAQVTLNNVTFEVVSSVWGPPILAKVAGQSSLHRVAVIGSSTAGLIQYVTGNAAYAHADYVVPFSNYRGNVDQMNDEEQGSPLHATNNLGHAYGVMTLQRSNPDYMSYQVRSNSIGSGLLVDPWETSQSPYAANSYVWVRAMQSDFGAVTYNATKGSFEIPERYTADQLTIRSNLVLNPGSTIIGTINNTNLNPNAWQTNANTFTANQTFSAPLNVSNAGVQVVISTNYIFATPSSAAPTLVAVGATNRAFVWFSNSIPTTEYHTIYDASSNLQFTVIANVALLNANQTFTGTNSWTKPLQINTPNNSTIINIVNGYGYIEVSGTKQFTLNSSAFEIKNGMYFSWAATLGSGDNTYLTRVADGSIGVCSSFTSIPIADGTLIAAKLIGTNTTQTATTTITQTNAVPVNAVTPVLWITVTNAGSAYRVPLYQ